MNNAELAGRKALTFEQAEGLAEMPRQLLPDEMPDTLRARLLNVLVTFVDYDRSTQPSREG
jgi:hypothetical protein